MSTQNTRLTWREALEDFENAIHGSVKPNTVRFYSCQLRQLQTWCLDKEIALDEFSKRSYNAYAKYRSEGGASERTIFHDFRAASKFFSYCFKQGYIAANPLKDYSARRPAATVKRVPSEKEIAGLIKSIAQIYDPSQCPTARFMDADLRKFLATRDTAIVALLVAAGCRIGEILSAEKKMLDLEKLTLTFTITKSNRPRTVPLPENLRDILKPWLRYHKDKEVPTLFFGRTGTPIHPSVFSRSWRRYLKYANITNFDRHGVRHFTISKIAQESIISAQEIAGHADIGTTRLYTHPDAQRIREDYEKANPLAGIFKKKTGKEEKEQPKRRII